LKFEGVGTFEAPLRGPHFSAKVSRRVSIDRAHHCEHRTSRNLKLVSDLSPGQPSLHQLGYVRTTAVEYSQATQFHTPIARCCKAGIDTLNYRVRFKFRDSQEHVHLKTTR